MKKCNRYSRHLLCLAPLLLTAFMAGCGDGGTATTVEAIAPTVITVAPADAASGVAINTNLSAIFSEAMNSATITTATFTLKQGTTAVAGAVTYTGITAIFNPTINLAASTTYTATITMGVKDVAGNALASNKTWSFTTGTTADSTAPVVSSTIPLDAASGVAINANVSATFNETMDPATLTTATVTLKQGTTAIAGAVTYSGTTVTFNPTANLVASTTYTATVTTGAKDLAGNALATNKVWTFTTGATQAAGPAPVLLGTAEDYVILAKTLVSTTGTTAIVGSIGLSPAARGGLTGWGETSDPSDTYSTSALVASPGKLYAADYVGGTTSSDLTTAVGNMQTAYTDAAGRTLPDFTELYSGDISARTLIPGLYKWGTGVSMTAAGVTLAGGPNDVWIFQIAQNLTVGNGAIVTLSGGALPKNIFWQVAGQVTLGTTADFKGIILSQTAIVMQTGAVLNGRALAQTAVTLDANAVTQPAP
ncbi:MAG: ice-binding family protein [Gallionellaceae bacterium]|nr:ice-binding family protein [Gallionellaceae bacterium]